MVTRVARQGWRQLLSIMETKIPHSIEVYGLLKTSLSGDWPFYNFWVDQWPHVTAVVASPKYKLLDDFSGKFTVLYGQDVGVVENILQHPGVIPWTRDLTFDLPPHLYPALATVANGDLFTVSENIAYMVTNKNYVKFDMTLKGIALDKPTRDDATFIAEKWRRDEPGVRDFIVRLLSTNIPSQCARTVDDRHIRAFNLTQPNNMPGMWYVDSAYRRKNLGRLVAGYNTEQLLLTSPFAATMIESDNTASRKAAHTVGWEPTIEIVTICFQPFRSAKVMNINEL